LITRYILKETAVPFALGLLTFTLLLLIARILKLVELVVNRGVPFIEVAKVFSYILPTFLEVTVPMALLLGVLIALGRMSSDGEIVALKAAGVSLPQITWPVALFALLIYVVALALALYARPWGNRLLRNGLYEIAKVRASAGIKPKVFNDDFAGLLIYVDTIDPPGNLLHGVLISDSREALTDRDHGPASALHSGRNTVVAKTGLLVPDEATHALTLRLFNGSVHSFDQRERSYNRTDFSTYDVSLDLGAAVAAVARERDTSEMALSELRDIAAAGGDGQHANVAAAEIQRRFSIPFACLAFAAVAIPLGLRPSNSVRSRGLILSLAVILAYYLSLTLGQSLAERGLLAAIPALWLPNVAVVALATVLLLRVGREPAMQRAVGAAFWQRWLQAMRPSQRLARAGDGPARDRRP
jgi:lipopolysaccharide export system permease protein